MKEYLTLYKTKLNDYNPEKNNIKSGLWDLNDYYFRDYRYYDKSLFTKEQSHYQDTIIINDIGNKQLFVTVQDFDIENHIADDDRPGLTNEFNSCKISYNNFINFRENWLALHEELPPFALIYRNDHDWVDCKGFESQEKMELFIKENHISLSKQKKI